MVATADLTHRLDRYLDALVAEIAGVPALLDEWPALTDEQRRAITYDWDVVLRGYWNALVQAALDRSLSASQRERFDALVRQIAAAQTALEQMALPALELRAT